MSMEYIRTRYGVPAKRNGKLRFTDSYGTVIDCEIKSAKGGYLKVLTLVKVAEYNRRLTLHPTWNVEYL